MHASNKGLINSVDAQLACAFCFGEFFFTYATYRLSHGVTQISFHKL